MVKTSSTMLSLGTPLPLLDLPVIKGTDLRSDLYFTELDRINNSTLLKRPVLIMIICAHCPFVKHIEFEISKIDQDYGSQIQILAISSNSLETHPQDSPENLSAQARDNGWTFPYLFDQDQAFAKALQAACTPDFFLFDFSNERKHFLKYRGQLDASRPGNDIPVNGSDLRKAIETLLSGKPLLDDQKPSIGCNIKWHPGKEPNWFG